MEWIKNNLNETIKFPIIVDDRGMVAEEIGMVHPGKGTNTVKVVFLVDAKGVV